MEFLQNFRLDRNSFWAGFLAASLFWWLVRIARPIFARLRQSFRGQAESARLDSRTVIEIRLRNETLRYAQSMHVASSLFSLDEIIIPTRLLSSGLSPQNIENLVTLDITETLIPDTPDWPQIASFYNWPSMSLSEALSGGANIAVIGQPGTGKSVALAYLASQLARRDIEISGMDTPVPLYIQAPDLVLPSASPETLSTPLVGALANYVSQQTFTRLPSFVDQILQEGRALLILDGLDELDPTSFNQAVDYLHDLLTAYPGLRITTAASTDYWGNLPETGFHILPLASWTSQQKGELLEKWGTLWKQHFSTSSIGSRQPDPDLIKGWLVTGSATLTPLELVCKTWAAFAGDSLGASAQDAIEATLRRKLHTLSDKQKQALEVVASQMLLTQQPVADRSAIESWLSGREDLIDLLDNPANPQPGNIPAGKPARSSRVSVRSSSAISSFMECGILRSHPSERYSISHPVWTAYLAAHSLDPNMAFPAFDAQKAWDARNLAMQFVACFGDPNDWIAKRLQKSESFLLPRFLLQASRWLPYAAKDAAWAQSVLRALANELHSPAWPENVKGRLLNALIGSGNAGVPVLLRQLLRTPEPETRKLAILGLGMVRDAKAVEDLVKYLSDESEPQIVSACILSLVAIGNKPALEAVASVMLQGTEPMKRSAAEAFANDPEEGHPTLKDASEMEDPAIRRAAVYGLARVNQPWADEIVETLRTQDSQWVVQDAANQVRLLSGTENPRIPTSQPDLSQSPWLIEFAASRGLGVAPGEPAVNLLYLALDEGESKHQLAALYMVAQKSSIARLPALENSYHSSEPKLRQAAIETIWRLQACGMDHPV